MTSTVHVEVSGLTGSGKSAVMGEIEIALKALGLKVEHSPEFQAEKNGTHADWQQALDLYQPTVVLTERNVSRQPPAREDAQPVAWRYRTAPHRGWHMTESSTDAEYEGAEGSEVQPLYTHPAPDALRVAVEALEFYRDGFSYKIGKKSQRIEWFATERLLDDCGNKALDALAALQAEQKGGAA